MIGQALKDAYFGLVRFATLPNDLRARAQYARRGGSGSLSIHLGSGGDYREGMINVEGNVLRKRDLWHDLRNALPFPNGSAALIYCSHVLEHLLPEDALQLLREARRVLATNGTLRLVVPSMEHALEIAAGRARSQWPRAFEDPLAQAVNYLFCDGQHKFAYSRAIVGSFASAAGFRRVDFLPDDTKLQPKRYGDITLGNEEEGSLVVELG